MTKRITLVILSFFSCACAVSVFIIGGQAGAYAWNLAVFIIAPAACLSLLIQLPLLVVKLFRKQNIIWNFLFLPITLLLGLPISVLMGISPICYPDNADPAARVTLTSPVSDAVMFEGADFKIHSMWPSERYAIDFLKDPYETGSQRLEDYGIFGQEVRAPISAEVIAAFDAEPDIIPGSQEFQSQLGNYLFLKIDGRQTYLILAHLQQGSLKVKTGDHVEQGQSLARVGNSGTSSEPHLHLQHQRNNPLDLKIPVCAEGLPILVTEN